MVGDVVKLARIAEPSVARTVANRLFFQKDFLTHNQVSDFVAAHWVGLFINPTRNVTC